MTPEEWIAHDPDPVTAAELAASSADELAARFARPLTFGTAGLRGRYAAAGRHEPGGGAARHLGAGPRARRATRPAFPDRHRRARRPARLGGLRHCRSGSACR
ncbi:putative PHOSPHOMANNOMUTASE PMMB domain protein [Mycobacterium kansasii]|uniref:Putative PHOSPHOMANNOMUTASE PMMB domain protein n=1 Tax=Mycobacterium kansasii TaxID=1768 RepID=A0A1V3WK91_MYCKA|nr:putative PHOSPHOMANNOMUTASE PMMB domain protein [Mycobacterium kansasii]